MPQLNAKARKERGQYFIQRIEEEEGNKSAWLKKVEKFREMYYRDPGATTVDEPWEGAVDLHMPIIHEKIETATPKILSALWRADPFVNVKAPSGENVATKALKKIERFLTWAFHNDIREFYLFLENFIRTMLLDGTAFAKIRWERKFRRGVDHIIINTRWSDEDTTLAGETIEQARDKTDVEILMEVFGFGDLSQTVFDYKKTKHGYKVDFTEAGRKYKGEVELIATDILNEVDVRIKRKFMQYDAPVCDLIEPEDIVLPSRSTDIQSATWVAHAVWYTKAEIENKMASGWNMTKADLRNLWSQAMAEDSESELKQQKDDVQGTSPIQGKIVKAKSGFDPNTVKIWEVYVSDFFPGDKDPIDVIYYISDDLDLVLGCDFHDDVYPHNMRPFIMGRYVPIPNRVYGIGMAELLYAINQEIDHTFSLVHNLMELVVNPFFFFTPFGMSANQEALEGIKPGTGIPTMDPKSVTFAEFSQQPLSLLHASSQTLLGYADRITFSPSVGGSSNYRNAPRTAKGTLALMDAAEEKLSTIVEQLQALPYKQLVTQVAGLYGMYSSADKWYTIAGEDVPRRMSTRLLRSNLQMEFSGSLTSVNRDIQRQLAERRYLVASKDPLYNSDPHARQRLLADYLSNYSDGTEVKPLIPALPGEGGFDHEPMDQIRELEALKTGVRVSVLPVDDHKAHIDVLEKFVKTEPFQVIDPSIALMIAEHKNAHQSALTQQIQQQNRILQQSAGESPEQAIAGSGAGEQPQQAAPEPGSPIKGIPGQGGELSASEGGIT